MKAFFDLLDTTVIVYLMILSTAAARHARTAPGPFELIGMLWRGEIKGRS